MDSTQKVVYGIMLGLIALGGLIYLMQDQGLIEANKPLSYYYSNGNSEFLVRSVSFENYIGYQIEFYYGDSPQPYFANLRYDPESLEDIELDRTIFHKISDDTIIFITIDPFANLTGKTTVAALEIDKFIDNKFFLNIRVNSSVTEEYSDYPIKTCADGTEDSTVIWLKLGEENRIISEDNCIIVEGQTQEDLIRGADRLALYLIGIMP